MMNFRAFAIGFAVALPMLAADVAQWPQFRGPGGSGLAGEAEAPVSFPGASRAAWKADIPAGQSSPSVWGDRIFLTAGDVKTKKLEVLCLDRKTGKVLWRRAVTAESIEHLHEVGTPATATPAGTGHPDYR